MILEPLKWDKKVSQLYFFQVWFLRVYPIFTKVHFNTKMNSSVIHPKGISSLLTEKEKTKLQLQERQYRLLIEH